MTWWEIIKIGMFLCVFLTFVVTYTYNRGPIIVTGGWSWLIDGFWVGGIIGTAYSFIAYLVAHFIEYGEAKARLSMDNGEWHHPTTHVGTVINYDGTHSHQCLDCHERIDPEVCYCGSGLMCHYGHTFVPMGYRCYEDNYIRKGGFTDHVR